LDVKHQPINQSIIHLCRTFLLLFCTFLSCLL
jgi:hypothetical protein